MDIPSFYPTHFHTFFQPKVEEECDNQSVNVEFDEEFETPKPVKDELDEEYETPKPVKVELDEEYADSYPVSDAGDSKTKKTLTLKTKSGTIEITGSESFSITFGEVSVVYKPN